MTIAALANLSASPADAPGAEPDDVTRSLLAAITADFAAAVEWDLDRRVIVFPQDHPTLGWGRCRVPGCRTCSGSSRGICPTCTNRWAQAGKPDLAEFVAIPKSRCRTTGIEGCYVPQCQRPSSSWRSRLCSAHGWQRQRLGICLEEFAVHPLVKGFESFGSCQVAACVRERPGHSPYCSRHHNIWCRARGSAGFDELRWRRTAPAITEGNQASLRGLPLRVAAELVWGLQRRSDQGVKTKPWYLRPIADAARQAEVCSLAELDPDLLGSGSRGIFNELLVGLDRRARTPETERHLDTWDLKVFGFPGRLRFDAISQPWLRDGVRAWAFDDLPSRRGKAAIHVQAQINSVARLSESLRLQRPDGGSRPARLSRHDIVAFCNRLAYLEATGTFSAGRRRKHVLFAREVLTRMRSLGLAMPGQPLHGLPEHFGFTRTDIPDEPAGPEAGRALPAEVIRQICAHLVSIDGTSCGEVRTAIELLIDTGRRPAEICRLPLDCLATDSDGRPVLVYDNHKAQRMGRRLPIGAPTAALIVAQQERVRAAFPRTPAAELKLLPTPVGNPHGRRSISEAWIGDRHRSFVQSMPDVMVPVAVTEGGTTTGKMVPFDKRKMFPYAYRHSYAQRHADAGVRVDVLRELMDHVSLQTTQGYYQVTHKRQREAVDLVTSMQFDRHGNRIWRTARKVLDSEHVRRAVGEVAVPYGRCTEPSNVAAGGEDCPLRFRCAGCAHFDTDVSYLPDLETYLADLLRKRERLLAAMDADDWAIAEAMPSDAEISRIRNLISQMKSSLDSLSPAGQAQISDAIATLRLARGNVVSLGIPRVRQPLPDVRPERPA